ncbi:F-box protein dre-1 (Daf-12 redundant function protein) [Durusdinium trenchii]|uniref:F-box protein dre-1 (Daf-12 redundant function protein) n=1 Tax=Durusdinium trenchii TaxID=1381693 RepID=A0ABP0PS82_9DINO
MEVDVLIRLEVRRVQRVADSTSMEIEALVAELQQRRSEHLGQRRQLLQFQQSSAQLSSDSQAWARSAVRRQAEENAQQVELHEELSVARSQLQHDEELVQEVHQHRRHEEAAYVSLLRDSARHARCEREKLVELQAQRAQLDARRPQLQTALQEVNEQRAHEANVCSFLKRKTEELQAEGHRLQTMHMESGSSCHATLELYRRQASEEAAALRLRRAQQQAKVTEEEMERMAFERRMAFRRRMEQRKKGPNDETGAISAVAVPAESTAETAQRQQGVANVMDIFQQVRTLVGLVSNAWSWSMRTNSTFRQVMPGLVRVHPGMGSETFIMQRSYFHEHLDQLIWPYLRFAICVPRDCASIAEALAKLPFWPPCTVLLAPKTTFREALAIDGTCVLLGGSGTVLAPAVLGAATLRRCRVVPPAAVWGKVSAGVATKGKAQLRLEHCTFQGWKSAAVCFRDDSDVTLKECRFEENPGTCISARNAASITVQQSSLTKNGGPVIQLRDATRLRLSESRLESNKGCGILVRGQAEAFIKSSCLEGHKMSAVAFQHQAKGSVLECRFERNDGAVVLVNGSAEVTVESNVFEKNGKSPPVLEFHGAAGPVKAKIVAKREKDVNGLTHQLSYISGAEGSDWANLDESAQMIRNRAGETNVPYQIKEPMRVGQQHDGEGGTLSGVNLQRGIKRSVLAVKDTAKATVRCNRMKANDGYGILVSDEAQAVMEENVLEEFKHAAIMLEGSASGVARTNTLSNNGGVGIQVQEKAKAILESNRIFQEKQPCIKVLGTSKSTIRQNYLLSSAARTARAAAAVLALDDAEVLVEENEVAAKRQVLRRSDGEEVEPERSPKSRRRNQPSGTMERKTGLRNFVRQDLDVVPLSGGTLSVVAVGGPSDPGRFKRIFTVNGLHRDPAGRRNVEPPERSEPFWDAHFITEEADPRRNVPWRTW